MAMIGTVAKRLTFEEFELLPDRPGKTELLRGELIELPPAKLKHNEIAERLFWRLIAIVDEVRARPSCPCIVGRAACLSPRRPNGSVHPD